MSQLLFKEYSEEILRKTLECGTAGMKVNGTPINNLKYADDTLILADILERMMNRMVKDSQDYGLGINIKQTNLWRYRN